MPDLIGLLGEEDPLIVSRAVSALGQMGTGVGRCRTGAGRFARTRKSRQFARLSSWLSAKWVAWEKRLSNP